MLSLFKVQTLLGVTGLTQNRKKGNNLQRKVEKRLSIQNPNLYFKALRCRSNDVLAIIPWNELGSLDSSIYA